LPDHGSTLPCNKPEASERCSSFGTPPAPGAIGMNGIPAPAPGALDDGTPEPGVPSKDTPPAPPPAPAPVPGTVRWPVPWFSSSDGIRETGRFDTDPLGTDPLGNDTLGTDPFGSDPLGNGVTSPGPPAAAPVVGVISPVAGG
jgi:hypothetical protein